MSNTGWLGNDSVGNVVLCTCSSVAQLGNVGRYLVQQLCNDDLDNLVLLQHLPQSVCPTFCRSLFLALLCILHLAVQACDIYIYILLLYHSREVKALFCWVWYFCARCATGTGSSNYSSRVAYQQLLVKINFSRITHQKGYVKTGMWSEMSEKWHVKRDKYIVIYQE